MKSCPKCNKLPNLVTLPPIDKLSLKLDIYLIPLLVVHVRFADPVLAIDEGLLGHDVLLQFEQGSASTIVKLKSVSNEVESRRGKKVLKWSCGQSYQHFMLVNFDFRVIITSKLHIIMTLES